MQLIILGMHRSGTSPLARLVNLMGAYVGPEGSLMPPQADNPKGFWERQDVYQLHQEILESVGGDWYDIPNPDSTALDWLEPELRLRSEEKIRQIVQGLDAHRPWVLKDPRMCLLLPLWQSFLEVPVCLHIYRNPVQVAQSLATRNGFPLRFGIALWEKYHVAALSHTRDFPRLLIAHRDLMEHPVRTVQTLYEELAALGVQRLECPSEREICAFLDARLQHEHGGGRLERELLNTAQLELFQAFEDRSVLRLESVPLLSAGAQEALTEYHAAREQDRMRQQVYTTLEDKKAEVERLRQDVTTQERAFQEVQKHLQRAEGELTAEREARQAEGERFEGEVDKREAEIERLQQEVVATQERFVTLQREQREVETVLTVMRTVRQVERQARTAVLQAKGAEMGQLRQQFIATKESLETVQAQLIRRETERIEGHSVQHEELSSQPREEEPSEAVLTFPQYAQPLVSILIPVFNKWAYTYSCLKTILENTLNVPYEVIIADDASTDRTKEAPHFVKHVSWVRNETNLGFLQNVNTGTQQARGEYVLILNNDVNVQAGWLNAMLELMQKDDKIGLVGAKLVYPNGTLQEAGGIIWADASGWNYGRTDDPQLPEYNYVKEVDYCSGACLLVRKNLWDQLGGFEQRFTPAYYEDTDLAFQIRALGYKVVYQPKAIVVHFEGVSHGTDQNEGLKRYQVKNKEKFYKKWQQILTQEHVQNGEQVFLARDRSLGKKRVVIVDHLVPTWDKDAGSKATYQYTKLLHELGYKITLVGDNFYRAEPYTSLLQQMGIEVLYGPWYNREVFIEWIQKNGQYINYVILNRPNIAYRYINWFKIHSQAKIIYYAHDIHWLRTKRQYAVEKDEKFLTEMKRWQRLEDYVMAQSDTSLVVSHFEAEFIKQRFPHKDVRYVPLFSYDTLPLSHGCEFEQRARILFVGSGHPPNADGVRWFIREVFPILKKRMPELEFLVCGSNMSGAVGRTPPEGICVLGYVSDEKLTDLYNAAKVVIAPLRYGAGVKGKIVEAMAFGVPIVTTRVGAEGLEEAEQILFASDQPRAFAEAVEQLYTNKQVWEARQAAGLQYVGQYFSTQAGKDVYVEILTKDTEEEQRDCRTEDPSRSVTLGQASPLLIFLHIVKTAGTTLLSIIHKNYRPEEIFYMNTPELIAEFKDADRAYKEGLKIIGGHFWYGIHEHIPQACRYFTIIRNPVERVVSHYYQVRKDVNHHRHRDAKRLTLEDYLCSDLDPQLNNGQVRVIAGLEGLPFGACTREVLDVAKQNLQHHFAGVGIAEEFDKSVALLQKKCGWKYIEYQKENIGTYRRSDVRLSDKVLDIIHQNNALDIELYNECAVQLAAATAR